jgi:hypothetical protein
MSEIDTITIAADSESDYRLYIKKKLGGLVPVLAHSAVGDYSVDVPLEDVDDDLGEIFAGVQFMLEAIREQMRRIEELELVVVASPSGMTRAG